VSWNLSVWRGPEDEYEAWEPLDVGAASDALDALPDVERQGEERWRWEGPSGGVSVELVFYGEPVVNELGVSVIFEPGDILQKRDDLRVLAVALFDAASRTNAVVGELGRGVFADVDAFASRGLAVDPWCGDEPRRSHVTRRELFGRFLGRD
jgi:hypothetical protein